MGGSNSGRRPKPTALKLLEGMRKDRINADEPKAAAVAPKRPSLSRSAITHWNRLSAELLALHILTALDGDALAMLCELFATRDRLAATKNEREFKTFVVEAVVDSDGGTHLKTRAHPVFAMERQTASAMRPYLAMFGLEPSGRAKLRAPAPKPQDKFKAFVGRQGGSRA